MVHKLLVLVPTLLNSGQQSSAGVGRAVQPSHPRDDCKEMLELFIVLLGGQGDVPNVKFRRPGAMHCSRWWRVPNLTREDYAFAAQTGGALLAARLSSPLAGSTFLSSLRST
ncbi:hypothetical protein GWK47_054615 [Chionoecetes opilio]|uniref:Secreted protein n=1 Tax=Chionoecetes opilio TaxID=41210 RepID=A0A8J5CRN2_CHIOP|nr:hypothetical protein GWK47_054615 [Chionoecetes opilio]